ncbi:response regulator [Alienimonas californiensis]|uniref:Response regulator PleD n=1 Tax=Alienimonas californiensis TaxID=2527989 RepID=A0A517PEV1_9PLAN|nr:response regulator [Alienimonas californiensis]QDT17902.1 Response regulator PleD [Alienimonas californiensis]
MADPPAALPPGAVPPGASSSRNSLLGAAEPGPSKLLIADDNIPNCELLDAVLSDQGHEVAFAHDGAETLEVAAAAAADGKPFDLVLLDIMMPKLSGYEVCQRMKADPALAATPVLMVTALHETGDIEKAVDAGCDDFLSKPINGVELKTRVRSLLRVRHLTNERDRLLAYLSEVDDREKPTGVEA